MPKTGISLLVGTAVQATRRALPLVLVGALLSGCGFFGGGGGSAGGPTSPPKFELDANGDVRGAIASMERQWQGYSVSIDVLSLQRHEKAARLTFVLTPRSRGNSDSLSTYFLSGDTKANVSGVELVDSAHLRLYRPLFAGETCVCSRDIESIPLDEPSVFFADFPVPPESVQKLTVVFPSVGPIPGVEVS